MRTHRRWFAIALVVTLAGCTSTAPGGSETTPTSGPPVATVASASPSDAGEAFPIEGFADIGEDPVSEDAAAEFQAILDDMAGKAGVSATVMTADGTWSGAAGKADGVRDVTVDDQFAIASAMKPIIAAQVMQMVEAGELDLDDPAADHLPPDLAFDANGATVRQLLGMRSGIPDYAEALWDRMLTDRKHRFTPAEILALVAAERSPAGEKWEYASTNYVLLGLIIEQVRGRPVADVLRDGVLRVRGTERLIYQPDEVPTEPLAMPDGRSTAVLSKGGGYLPSLAGATAADAAGAMASDSRSLARWYRAFCAGEIVSEASLTEMSTLRDGGPGGNDYGLGLYNPADDGVPYANAVGHAGQHEGYVSWAGCVPEDGSVVVVLMNNDTVDLSVITQRLIDAVPANDPLSPFLGTWTSTEPGHFGSSQMMKIRRAEDDALGVTLRDDSSGLCSDRQTRDDRVDTPSTMAGPGRLEDAATLVVPSPVLACVDGRKPHLSWGYDEEGKASYTLVLDLATDRLFDNLGVAWHRGVTPENGTDATSIRSRPEGSGTYSMLGGELIFHADPPWSDHVDSYIDPFLFWLAGAAEFEILVNPNPLPEDPCDGDPAPPASAEALVQAIRSNPDLEVTVPVAERVGGIDALRLDVAPAPGTTSTCRYNDIRVVSAAYFGGDMSTGEMGRLYVLDLPGGSARTLGIWFTAPEAGFELAVEAVAPIVGSFEFHTG